jgi:hypothetical protein
MPTPRLPQSSRSCRPTPWCRRASGLVFAAALAAQTPPPITGRSGETSIVDAVTTSLRHLYGDARGFRAKATRDRIECVLEMQKPLIEGMFTCVELWIDCDDKPATGLDGRELRIRAAVGSRFQPSAAVPVNGGRKPIDHLRISGTDLQPGDGGGVRWVHRHVQAQPPVVHGNELRFWFPRSLVRERGDRYHGRIAMRVVVETSCSDQPIERLHVANDEGLPIRIDGDDTDWSAVRVRDPGDELHPVARCVDLIGLRIEHGDDCLFASVELAEAGLDSWSCDDDVQGSPSVTLLVEPMFPRYQQPYEVSVFGSMHAADGTLVAGTWQSACGDRLVEVRLPRQKGQNRLRVIALSDFVLRDSFDTELRLDTEVR